MDRKELLLKLCEELTKTVEIFYSEETGLRAFIGEVLIRYANLLSDIGHALIWANKETQDKVFEIIEDAFRKQEEHRLKCRLEEWLAWKVSEAVDEA
jgi:hypothetical protein